MKKFALIALASAVAMVGCTNTTPMKQDTMAHATMQMPMVDVPVSYVCEGDASVVAKYNSNASMVTTTLTVPSLSLVNATVPMKQTMAGSGALYENKMNPSTSYQWHTKAHDGVLTIAVNGMEYDFVCKLDKPMM